MRRLPTVLGLLGLGLATCLVLWQGWSGVLLRLAGTGMGLLWISLFHVVPMALNTHAWQLLLPGARRRPLGWFAWIFWIRESVNGLLPVARLGAPVLFSLATTEVEVVGPVELSMLPVSRSTPPTHLPSAELIPALTVGLLLLLDLQLLLAVD